MVLFKLSMYTGVHSFTSETNINTKVLLKHVVHQNTIYERLDGQDQSNNITRVMTLRQSSDGEK